MSEAELYRVINLRLDGSNRKLYWFELPEQFSHVTPREKVLCETRYGFQPGVAFSEPMYKGESELVELGATMPIRKVVSIAEQIRVDSICIPTAFQESKPSIGKVSEKMAYYNRKGKFDKLLIVRRDSHMLVDGYINFLIAKQLNIEYIDVFCI